MAQLADQRRKQEIGPLKLRLKRRVSFEALFKEFYPDHFQGESSLCPFHDDNANSFYVKKDHGFCMAGCRPQTSNAGTFDIFDLVSIKNELGLMDAVNWLADREGLNNVIQHRGPVVASWVYRYEDGAPAFEVRKYDLPRKSFTQHASAGDGKWKNNLDGARIVLYRLPEVIEAEEVWIAEGEKDAENLVTLGLCGSTSPMGAEKWAGLQKKWDIRRPLRGKIVYLLGDNDETGQRHVNSVAKDLLGWARVVKILTLPGLEAKGDVSDFIAARKPAEARQTLLGLAVSAPEFIEKIPEKGGKGSEKKETPFTNLMAVVETAAPVWFSDQFGCGWGTLSINGVRQNVRIRSHKFETWMAKIYWDFFGRGLPSETARSAQKTLEAQATFGTEKRDLHLRAAWDKDHNLLLDKADSTWQCFKITPKGWEIIQPDSPPFRREVMQSHFPDPEPHGDSTIFELLDFLPVKDHNAQIRLAVWLVSAWLADLPRPGILFHGHAGSGKSSATEWCKMLVDPSVILTNSIPDKEEEFTQQLDQQFVSAYDNLEGLPKYASAVLAKAITRHDYTKRELYTSNNSVLYSMTRTWILNGIDVPIRKSDLMDRTILIPLVRISDTDRRGAQELEELFESRRGKILNLMLDTLSRAMRAYPRIELKNRSRLADWHRWSAAIAVSLDIPLEIWNDIVSENVKAQQDEIMGSHPVAVCLTAFMQDKFTWGGRVADLYRELEKVAEDEGCLKDLLWPRSARGLSRAVNQLIPSMAGCGIEISHKKDSDGIRLLGIKRIV